MTLPTLPRVFACLLLAGCALVDQRTFAPAPAARAAPAATAPALVTVDARTPLVTIDFSGQAPRYQEMLGYAVRAAETRDHDVQYDVVAELPKPTDARESQNEAVDVMRTIMREGVPASRIHLGLSTTAALSDREVRIYVR